VRHKDWWGQVNARGKQDKESTVGIRSRFLRINWDKWSKIASIIGVVVAVAALVVTLILTVWSVERSAYYTTRSLQVGRNVAAMAVLDNHYQFASDKGVGLTGEKATNATAPEEESSEKLVAQHGLLTANLVFDLTEGTGEHNEMRNVSKLLLLRYRKDIEQAKFPCGGLDDEFVDFARSNEVEVDPCQGPLDRD
jgi:hypothetical protein